MTKRDFGAAHVLTVTKDLETKKRREYRPEILGRSGPNKMSHDVRATTGPSHLYMLSHPPPPHTPPITL